MLSNSVNEQVGNKVEVETSRIIKKMAQRNAHRISTLTKLLMCLL